MSGKRRAGHVFCKEALLVDAGHACDACRPRGFLWLLPLASLAASVYCYRQDWPAISWSLLLGALALALILVGWYWRRNPRGILVTARNVASLHQFQLIAWATLVSSAIIFVAAINAHGLSGRAELIDGVLERPEDPLGDVALQAGAAVATTAGATAILVSKRKQAPRKDLVVASAKSKVHSQPGMAIRRLVIATAPPPADQARQAQRWIDGHEDQVPDGISNEVQQDVVEKRLSSLISSQRTRKGASLHETLNVPAPTDVEECLQGIAYLIKKLGAAAAAKQLEELMHGSTALQEVLRVQERLPLVLTNLPRFRFLLKRLLQANETRELQDSTVGLVYQNACPCQARLTDILEGDEGLNHESKDGSKVQFLLFTLAGLFAFGAVLWQAFEGKAPVDIYLPRIPEHLTEIVGASGAGYLVTKLPNRSA